MYFVSNQRMDFAQLLRIKQIQIMMSSYSLIQSQTKYYTMEPQQFGSIEPWLDESNRLPLRLFKRRAHTTHTLFPNDKLTRLNKTEQTVFRKIKTQANGITFKYDRHNEVKVISLDLAFREQAKSSNLKHIHQNKHQQGTNLCHKRSIRGFSLSSVKKKPINLYDITSGHCSHQSEQNKSRRIKSASHFLATHKATHELKDHSQSLNVSKIDLKTIPVTDSHDFFREIANLWKLKNKILAKQPDRSQNAELEVQRQLFRNRNRKFKSWQTLQKRMDSSKG